MTEAVLTEIIEEINNNKDETAVKNGVNIMSDRQRSLSPNLVQFDCVQ